MISKLSAVCGKGLKEVWNCILGMCVHRDRRSSVGSDAGCQSWGCAFEPQLGQHSFPTFDKSHCDKRHLSSTNGLLVYVEKQPVAWKECCMKCWCEKAKKHMIR